MSTSSKATVPHHVLLSMVEYHHQETLSTLINQLSSIDTWLPCISFPVVKSNLGTTLSVTDAGQVTLASSCVCIALVTQSKY